MRPKYTIRYFFDGVVCLWSGNECARERFGYNVDHHKLPLSPETVAKIDNLLAWYDTSLNWEYPPHPGPWRQEECDRFNQVERAILETIRCELGEEFIVVDEHRPLAEDPHLDEYLRNPRGFK
jgi:hypothetical protein